MRSGVFAGMAADAAAGNSSDAARSLTSPSSAGTALTSGSSSRLTSLLQLSNGLCSISRTVTLVSFSTVTVRPDTGTLRSITTWHAVPAPAFPQSSAARAGGGTAATARTNSNILRIMRSSVPVSLARGSFAPWRPNRDRVISVGFTCCRRVRPAKELAAADSRLTCANAILRRYTDRRSAHVPESAGRDRHPGRAGARAVREARGRPDCGVAQRRGRSAPRLGGAEDAARQRADRTLRARDHDARSSDARRCPVGGGAAARVRELGEVGDAPRRTGRSRVAHLAFRSGGRRDRQRRGGNAAAAAARAAGARWRAFDPRA